VEALAALKIPVGRGAEAAIDWLQGNGAWFFDWLEGVLEGLVEGVLWLLQAPHPLVVIAAFVGITWALQRNWRACLVVLLCLLYVLNQGDWRSTTYWELTTQSLTLVLTSCAVCMGLGIPIGIAAAHRPRLHRAIAPLLDLMQTLPTFVYLIPAVVFFGLGLVPGLIATVIFVLPAPVRLTHLGISSTPAALWRPRGPSGRRRARRFGRSRCAGPSRRSWRGSTKPSCCRCPWWSSRAGGRERARVPVVARAQLRDTALGFESGLVIVVVAIMLDRMLRVERRR
jgi:glycine betaine/proline transport system permease protein